MPPIRFTLIVYRINSGMIVTEAWHFVIFITLQLTETDKENRKILVRMKFIISVLFGKGVQ